MNKELTSLLNKLNGKKIVFKDVVAFIDQHYQHHPTAFKNGNTYNEASQNQGSARVFAFAQINNLSKENTLQLFAEHYQAVLNTPLDTDHQNIRQFMAHGWAGIAFEGKTLEPR